MNRTIYFDTRLDIGGGVTLGVVVKAIVAPEIAPTLQDPGEPEEAEIVSVLRDGYEIIHTLSYAGLEELKGRALIEVLRSADEPYDYLGDR